MSRIRGEIKKVMHRFEKQGDGASAAFVFPEHFTGFQGHFEGNPVLPGICKIQAAQAVMEEALGVPLRLKEVAQAKYMAPVTCGQEIRVSCTPSPSQGNGVGVRAVVMLGETKAALLQLLFEKEETSV